MAAELASARLARDITSQPSERKDRWWTSMVSERKNREYVDD